MIVKFLSVAEQEFIEAVNYDKLVKRSFEALDG